MRLLNKVALVVVLGPALVPLQAKTKKPYKLPAVFNQARYFYVEAVDGQQYDPRLYPEDRQAIADTIRALQKWNRYTYTVQRDQADLIFVVRKGREVETRVGIQVGTGTQGLPGRPSTTPGTTGPGVGTAAGGEVGPPDDLLEVYMQTPNEPYGTLLWQRSEAYGLDGPNVRLLQVLKDEVEKAYPPQTASQAQKP
jgi:hypothetical protein